jgi:hypothetical protein
LSVPDGAASRERIGLARWFVFSMRSLLSRGRDKEPFVPARRAEMNGNHMRLSSRVNVIPLGDLTMHQEYLL